MQPSQCGGVLKCREIAGQEGLGMLGARASTAGQGSQTDLKHLLGSQ